eukprot:TRINITY_DN3310_c0_g5_i1.p2 TRINITY_DN3310_c0_g5~~TRINITY_DN3310_c0_g5_i1.p2  ORF type:complete len:131 (-),score=11.15 TRINITY_DN3310_c0_g5_i1:194-586(-)
MTPEEVAPSSKSISETPINIKKKLSTFWQLREPIPDSTFLPEEKQPSQLAMFFLSVKSQKEQLSATSNPELVIKEVSQDVQVPMPQLLVTLKMDPKLESDFPQDLERLSTVTAEPLSELLRVEVEMISLS